MISLAYKTFFNGLNKFSKQYSEDDTITFIDKNIVKYSFSILEELRSIYKLDGTKAYKNFYKNHDDKWKTLWLKVNYEPFKGYLHFLPQYYRNLYTIVKFVVNDNADLKLDDEDKLKYLRILRSTLSDYEQTMLFYNWYSGIGEDWEKGNNKFFSKYKMIHNMKRITLIDSEIKIFTILGISPTADFFENY
ncbi:MAG: putative phage abortive infection protein [Chryseobacterium taeanense]